MSGNYMYITNGMLYHGGGNFDNFGGFGQSTGNFALIDYGNNYFTSGTNFGLTNNSSSNFNYHQGPRNSISGINSSNRSNVSGMKGISVKPSNGGDSKASSLNRNMVVTRNVVSSTNSGDKYTSKEVTRGTGLSTNGRIVTSSSTKRAYDNSSTNSRTNTPSTSVGRSGSQSRQGSIDLNSGSGSRSNAGGGSTKSSGGGSVNTQGRRGGN